MSIWSRLVRTFRTSKHEAEVEEELRFHLAMKERDGIDVRQARLRFGNPASIGEETRSMGIIEWFEGILQDVRYGIRQIGKSPALTLTIILSLTIGIGANSAIFGIVDTALLKTLPVRDPQSLVMIEWTSQGWPEALVKSHSGNTDGDFSRRMQASSVAPRLHRQLAREQTAFESLIGFSDLNDAGVVVEGRPAEQANLQYVSGNFFQGLGISPAIGRAFTTEDDRVGGEAVVVVSHRLWQRQLGGRADVLGRTLRINSVPARIIGVAPPEFFGIQIGEWNDVYAPLAAQVALNPRVKLDEALGEQDTYWWVRQMARLKPGANEDAARQELSAHFQRLVVPEGVKMDSAKTPSLVVSPAQRGFNSVPVEVSRALWVLLLLVGLILLIVCANVANLLLSRAVTRQRESAVRLSLGAPRLRLLRQQLIESLVLSLAAGVLGLALGYVLAISILAVFASGSSTSGFDLRIDLRIIAYTAAISIFTAMVFGLAPALQMARADWSTALKTHSRSVLSGRLRLPRVLVVVQIALCLTVLVAAGLLSRSLANLKFMDLGFDRNNIVYATMNPWRAGYKTEQVGPFVDRVRDKLKAIPGVTGVATIRSRPLSGSASSTVVNLPGRPFRTDGSDSALVHSASDGLIETLGIPLIAGRTFEARDIRPGSESTIVDELFVRKYFPDQNPIGRRFGLGRDNNNNHEIIGVVKSSRYNSLRRDLSPTVYRPILPGADTGRAIHFVTRSGIDARDLANSIRRAALEVDADVPVDEIRTQTALIDRMLRTDRLLSILSTAFGAIALVLAGVGLAGLLAYAVARRTNEIGIRMALGAAPGDVVRMVLSDSMWLVVAGILLGLPCAYAIGQVLKGFLFGLQPVDPLAAGTALVTLAIIAAIAAWLPARRAASIDPMSALREE